MNAYIQSITNTDITVIMDYATTSPFKIRNVYFCVFGYWITTPVAWGLSVTSFRCLKLVLSNYL